MGRELYFDTDLLAAALTAAGAPFERHEHVWCMPCECEAAREGWDCSCERQQGKSIALVVDEAWALRAWGDTEYRGMSDGMGCKFMSASQETWVRDHVEGSSCSGMSEADSW